MIGPPPSRRLAEHFTVVALTSAATATAISRLRRGPRRVFEALVWGLALVCGVISVVVKPTRVNAVLVALALLLGPGVLAAVSIHWWIIQ